MLSQQRNAALLCTWKLPVLSPYDATVLLLPPTLSSVPVLRDIESVRRGIPGVYRELIRLPTIKRSNVHIYIYIHIYTVMTTPR